MTRDDGARTTPTLGVLQVELATPWARSLKEKRASLLPLLARWRRRSELSVARTDGLDAHGWEVWVVATVDADAARVRTTLERARADVAREGLELRAARIDVEGWDPLEAGDAVGRASGPDVATR